MNRNKHNYTAKQARTGGEWEIYDNGVLHSDGYANRAEALERIDQLEDEQSPVVNKKELDAFFAELKSVLGTS